MFEGNHFCILFDMAETGTVNPKVLLELFSVYRDWQDGKAQKISKKQVRLETKQIFYLTTVQ